jgi:hypothetical protein
MISEGPRTRDDRSLGELFADLSRETTTLIRQELQLARTEMSQKVGKLGKDAGTVVAGGLIAYAGFLTLVDCLVILLAEAGLALWASTLLVGVVVAGAGAAMIWKGVAALRSADLTPRQTMETLEEGKQWVEEQTT